MKTNIKCNALSYYGFNFLTHYFQFKFNSENYFQLAGKNVTAPKMVISDFHPTRKAASRAAFKHAQDILRKVTS